VKLTGLDGASIYEYDEAAEEFRLQVADSMAPEFLQAIRGAPIRKGDGTVGGVAITLEPAQVPDILDDSYHSSRKELLVGAGYRAVLTVPLLREDHIIGALNVRGRRRVLSATKSSSFEDLARSRRCDPECAAIP
jgi:signal transduction protein with GAF and PtsI domain